MLLSQLNQVNFRKIRRTATEYRSDLAIQRLVLVTDPDMLAEPLRPINLVVADPEVVARYPYHRAPSP